MIKKVMYILGFFFLTTSFVSVSATSWKVFVYMNSSDDLSDMAIKNISDMIYAKPSDTVDFLIQLHAYDLTALRYRVTSNGLAFIEDITLTGNSKQDFINGAHWAFADNRADRTMFIAWDHGWGILDPRWNPDTEKWEANSNELSAECEIKRSITPLYDKHRKNHKGFMFTMNPRTYLTNQDLIDCLRFIKENVLHGKKLDIFAFDTCMGAMFEVAYQVAPYAHYLVGNQTCSMRDGFNYRGIVRVLNQEPSPRDMVKGMVDAFNTYYTQHDESGMYTHAAIDLAHVYSVKEALDKVVHQLLNMPNVLPIITKAREQAPRFCLFPMYTDLVSFFKKIDEQLPLSSRETNAPRQSLKDFYSAVEGLVVARGGGHAMQDKAHGVAIYLPLGEIDDSYFRTIFGRQSAWINLLEKMGSK